MSVCALVCIGAWSVLVCTWLYLGHIGECIGVHVGTYWNNGMYLDSGCICKNHYFMYTKYQLNTCQYWNVLCYVLSLCLPVLKFNHDTYTILTQYILIKTCIYWLHTCSIEYLLVVCIQNIPPIHTTIHTTIHSNTVCKYQHILCRNAAFLLKTCHLKPIVY